MPRLIPSAKIPSAKTASLALTLLVCAVAVSTAAPVAPPANVTAPPAPSVPLLTVVPGGAVRATGPGQGTAEAGPLDPARTPHPEFRFTLRNDGAVPVSIARLRGSCGCETLTLSQGKAPVRTATLAPGGEAQVSVAVRVAGQHGGRLRKYAWVYGPGGDQPLATLEMALTLREAAQFSPGFLDFGQGAQGVARSRPLLVTVDRASLAGGTLPALTSTNPDVRATPDGAPQAVVRDGVPALAQKYAVTLDAQAPGGRVAGDLLFPPGAAPLGASAVPVSGEVSGRLSATPRTLFFGSVTAGRAVTRQVVLSAASPGLLRSLTVSGASAWLTAALDGTGASSPRLGTLSVTLSGRAPAGPLEGQVILTSAGGERLVLPVVALVSAPAARR